MEDEQEEAAWTDQFLPHEDTTGAEQTRLHCEQGRVQVNVLHLEKRTKTSELYFCQAPVHSRQDSPPYSVWQCPP